MLGNPARLDELRQVAERHGVALIEDDAQAFGPWAWECRQARTAPGSWRTASVPSSPSISNALRILRPHARAGY